MSGSEHITKLGFETAKRLDPRTHLWVWAKGTRWARILYPDGNKWVWHPWVIRGLSTDYAFPPDWRPTKEQIKAMKKLRKEANHKQRRSSEHGTKISAERTKYERQWVTVHLDSFASTRGHVAGQVLSPPNQQQSGSQEQLGPLSFRRDVR